jgi:lysine 2,3-aminomutase
LANIVCVGPRALGTLQVNKLLTLEEEPPSSATAENTSLIQPLVQTLKRKPVPASVPAITARTRFATSPERHSFLKRFYPGVKLAEWSDWRWQNRNRIRSLGELERIIRVTDDEREAISRHSGPLPIGLTPYYMSLVDAENPNQPLRKTVIPTLGEFERVAGEEVDPLGEDHTCIVTPTECCCS